MEIDSVMTCINNKGYEDELTIGKSYKVVWHTGIYVIVINDNKEATSFRHSCFGPVPTPKYPSVPMSSPPPSKVITNEHIYMFDTDETLVLWDDKFTEPGQFKTKIHDPYGKKDMYLTPHGRHINLLKQMHGRGRHIIVWSAGGALWAEAVVKALGLDDYVHQIMTKPLGYVDDLPAQEVLTNRIYFEPEKNNG